MLVLFRADIAVKWAILAQILACIEWNKTTYIEGVCLSWSLYLYQS